MAISIEGPTFGRQIKERDILYTYISEEDYKLLTKDFAHLINDEEKALLKKIIEHKDTERIDKFIFARNNGII